MTGQTTLPKIRHRKTTTGVNLLSRLRLAATVGMLPLRASNPRWVHLPPRPVRSRRASLAQTSGKARAPAHKASSNPLRRISSPGKGSSLCSSRVVR